MKKRKISFISFILILIICCFSLDIFATNPNDLYTQKEDAKNELENANSELEGIQIELSATLQQIQSLNETITKYEQEIEELNTKVEALEVEIGHVQRDLEIATMDYEEKRTLLEKRLVVLYEAGETTYLDFILTSKSLTEFISNYYLIRQIVEYDANLLQEIDKQKNEIETTKKKLEEQRKEYDIIKTNASKKAVILKNTTTIRNDYYNKLTEEEKVIQNKIDQYEYEVALIESEIGRLLQEGLDPTYVGGIMAWPVPGYTRITSPYGMRIHPITGVYKLHTGVDVSAPTGANFIAANDGIVIKAGDGGAYGNMVIIDHGGGVTTLYAHGSEIVVTLGQEVKKGDVVLKVGSTGYSTGPHAHFEVRINNVVQDPMPYITSTVEDVEE